MQRHYCSKDAKSKAAANLARMRRNERFLKAYEFDRDRIRTTINYMFRFFFVMCTCTILYDPTRTVSYSNNLFVLFACTLCFGFVLVCMSSVLGTGFLHDIHQHGHVGHKSNSCCRSSVLFGRIARCINASPMHIKHRGVLIIALVANDLTPAHVLMQELRGRVAASAGKRDVGRSRNCVRMPMLGVTSRVDTLTQVG